MFTNYLQASSSAGVIILNLQDFKYSMLQYNFEANTISKTEIHMHDYDDTKQMTNNITLTKGRI